MTIDLSTIDLSDHDRRLITRAGSHALAGECVHPIARFGNHVTDLDVARLMLRLERGSIIVQSAASPAWLALNEIERETHLTRIVNEAIRVGLVYRDTVRTGPSTWRMQLVPARTHLRRGAGRTACPESDEKPYGRYRTVTDPDLVDCSACFARHR